MFQHRHRPGLHGPACTEIRLCIRAAHEHDIIVKPRSGPRARHILPRTREFLLPRQSAPPNRHRRELRPHPVLKIPRGPVRPADVAAGRAGEPGRARRAREDIQGDLRPDELYVCGDEYDGSDMCVLLGRFAVVGFFFCADAVRFRDELVRCVQESGELSEWPTSGYVRWSLFDMGVPF